MVIIAAVDRSNKAARVVEEAEVLAKEFGDTVHVIHVLPRSEFVELGKRSVEAGDPVDMDAVRDLANDIAANAAEDSDAPVKTIGLMGDPSNQVIQYAKDNDARYIVIASRKRSPAGKAIFGSVAQSILLNSNCPVVSIVANGN